MKILVLFAFLCLCLGAILMTCLYFNPTDWIKTHEGYWISFIILDSVLLSAVFSMIARRVQWPPENQEALRKIAQSPKNQKRRSMALTGSFLVYCSTILILELNLDHTTHNTIIVSIPGLAAIYLIAVAFFILLISAVQTGRKRLGLPEIPVAHVMWASNLSKAKLLSLSLAISMVYGGIYILLYRYNIENGHYPFWLKLESNYNLAFVVLAAIAIYNWVYSRTQKRKLASSLQAQETLNLKLRSIRSQLNPHFMFNALTSIQNLMNKNDIPAANHYLSMFADLTRKVLNTSDQELISMEDELKILEDYLQMEQLRFGFKYEITVDEAINIANTEIPAMLLQPFVENAIKHGVAVLSDKGLVTIAIKKQANNIVLSVSDNGKGFDLEQMGKNKASLGLKLSEERIALLNQVNKRQPVTFDINTQQNGTRITITLVNLLS